MEAIMNYVQSFFGWLFQTTLIASVVICLILLIQKLLGGKLGARWCHALWLVLLIRMVLPWAPSSRLSLFSLIPSLERQIQLRQLSGAPEQHEPSEAAQTSGVIEAIPDQRPEPDVTVEKQTIPKPEMLVNMQKKSKPRLASLRRVLPVLWLAGAMVVGAYLLMSNFALWRIVKEDRPLVNQPMLELFEECKAQIGVQSLVVVVPSDRIRSPSLFGFIRPRLLLPREMLDTATREEMRYVFLHELAHLRRHDIYLGWLASLLQVLHWFNPLIWFAFYRMRADRELACDALVLTRTGQDKSQEYGGAIVGLLRRFSRSRPLPAMAGILENRSQLKRRVSMIAEFNKNSYKWSPLAIVLIIILACISLPDARDTKASETSIAKSTHKPYFRKIWIPTKPGNGVLSPDGKKLAFVSKRSIWVVPVHGKVSSDIAGEPVRLPGTQRAWRWGMSWSADGKWIAYNNLKNDEIRVVPSSGGKVKRISVNKNRGVHLWNYRLSLSPDGKIVAFAAIEKGEIQLFTSNVDSGDVNQITEDGGTQPAFSPDGKKITYVKERPQKRETPESDVWVTSSAGGTPVQVSDLPGRAIAPIWSPDGKMIAFTRTAEIDESKEICIVQVSEDGNPEASPTQIELPLVTWNFLAGWTPDNKIGVLLTEPVHRAIYTVPASGGNAVQVTPAGWPCHPRWSPDGERIYFRWGGGDLASVPSEGGEISTAPLDTDSNIFAALPGGGNAVSPDGKKIVFSGAKMVLRDNNKAYQVDIYTIPIEGGEPKKLATSPGQDRFPCWSPDGKSIAFIRHTVPPKEKDNVIMSICIVPAEGGEVRQFTSESDKVAWATIAWSPDGKSIAYFSEDKAIRIIPVQGGQPRIVVKVEDVNSHSELAWSPDGSKLAYSSKGSIWAVSLDGGEPEEIKTGLDAKSNHLSWSPDGKKIAFSAAHGGDQELWLMENFLPGTPVTKPAHQPSFRKIRIPTEISWDMHLSPDGQKVSLVSDKKLWIMPLAGHLRPDIPGAPVELGTENIRVAWTAHTWSGDGNWIAFNEYPVDEGNEENEGNQGIYIVSTEGGKPKKVYENYRDERTVNYRISLSPWGKTLAFSSVDLERKEQHIYTIPVDGGLPKQLVDAQAREPVFSPDGKMIAFVEDKNVGRGGGDLWVVPAQGGTPTHVVDAENATSPVWSPKGDMIAFLDHGKKRTQINFIPIGENGEAAGDLITIDAPEGIDGIWLLAGWSPDNKIGAIFERRGETGLYTLPTKGGKAMQVARGGGQPRWSPDGKRIFIVARARRRTGAWQRFGIASIPAEGGRIKTVPIRSASKMYIPYFGVGNRVSPDGKMIVFSGKTQYDPVNFLHNHIWTLPVGGGVPEQLTEAPRQSTDMFPCWSPDGKTIAFVRTRIPEKIGEISDYKTNIYTVQADGGEPTSLTTESDSVSFGPIEWSPNGKFVAYFSQEDDASSSGNLRIISTNGDGKSRIIGRVRDPHPGMQFAWSPDSKRIAFDGPDGKVIKIISLEDGSTVKIETGLVDSNIGDRLDWSPDGERFVFVGGKGESKEFWVMENFLAQDMGK